MKMSEKISKRISKKISVITAITVTAIILCGVGAKGMVDVKKVNPWYLNVLAFGAKPNDNGDDTEALKKAFKTSGTVYLPEGEYTIKDGLYGQNITIVGDGSDKTVIVADYEDKSKPILQLARTVSISGVTFKYKDGLVTGEEKESERIGIYGAGQFGLQRGSAFCDVKIENVGTGMACGLGLFDGAEDCVFSVTFDKFSITDFSYRGFNFKSDVRTGNYYKDVTLSSGKYRADSAVYFDGEESECAIDSLIVKDTVAETPVVFNRMNTVSAKLIRLDNVYALHHSIITWDSSTADIDELTFDYCDTHFSENPMILVGSVKYISEGINTLNGIHVGTLKLNSFNSANVKNIIARNKECEGDFYFTVDKYTVKNSDFLWDDFPADESGIIITKKGEIATEGDTSNRPDKCLCPYYSRYFDTELNKTVVWNGKEWK